MIKTVIADTIPQSGEALVQQLDAYCPQIRVTGVTHTAQETCHVIEEKQPELVFLQWRLLSRDVEKLMQDPALDFETIVLYAVSEEQTGAVRPKAVSCLYLPVTPEALVNAVHRVEQWRHLKSLQREQIENRAMLRQLLHQSPPNDLIGIPTMEGMEFLKIEEIVRCEGLNSFTRVALADGTGIISSYHIGAFRELLGAYGFFAPHRSHLVNLQYLRKYLQEGTLLLRDGSTVPVSRRRRHAFLEHIRHL